MKSRIKRFTNAARKYHSFAEGKELHGQRYTRFRGWNPFPPGSILFSCTICGVTLYPAKTAHYPLAGAGIRFPYPAA